jgi:hypothetical protein
LRFAFNATATGVNLAGTTIPVAVTLTIGANGGRVSVADKIAP